MVHEQSFDVDCLSAAVEIVLKLLNEAEQEAMFPHPGDAPSDLDAMNEAYKLEYIKRERKRYQDILARLNGDNEHGVPVAMGCLELALGIYPTVMDEPEGDR